jgi:ATP-dependent DNA helicase RecQ
LLLSRNVVRFVIDEAHCFSAWGQDFRVDYLYIGDFIRELQKKKQMKYPVPVSCFTATAKQKVISDICDYFKQKLDVDLELYASSATRENLHYAVLYKETDEDKYNALRSLIEQKNCPTIVYVSRTRRCQQLAEKLTSDGFLAKPYYGKMDPNEKIANQEAFKRNEIKVIVATSAFGMGVDKADVKLVIHYDISDSLENYVQEAGRA